jgi:hypothetical protein
VKVPLVPVQIGNGIVVLHTAAEWRRLIANVDMEAAEAATAPIQPEPEEHQ